jgi:hypothetical protein
VSYVDLQEMGMIRPSRCACLNEARSLFEQFHLFSPEELRRARCRRVIPPVLMHVGELRGLIYRSDRGHCGSPRTFIHFMRTPARLACDPEGRQLYVLGGRYRVTPRGIEG